MPEGVIQQIHCHARRDPTGLEFLDRRRNLMVDNNDKDDDDSTDVDKEEDTVSSNATTNNNDNNDDNPNNHNHRSTGLEGYKNRDEQNGEFTGVDCHPTGVQDDNNTGVSDNTNSEARSNDKMSLAKTKGTEKTQATINP